MPVPLLSMNCDEEPMPLATTVPVKPVQSPLMYSLNQEVGISRVPAPLMVLLMLQLRCTQKVE